MTKRFTTNGYKIYDTFHDGMHWLVNEVEAEEIVTVMNNLDTKARERSKALSKLQKENKQLRTALKELREIGDYQADRIQELSDENEQLESVLLGVINRLYYSENSLIWETSSHISEDELELKEEFKKEFGKYGWKK